MGRRGLPAAARPVRQPGCMSGPSARLRAAGRGERRAVGRAVGGCGVSAICVFSRRSDFFKARAARADAAGNRMVERLAAGNLTQTREAPEVKGQKRMACIGLAWQAGSGRTPFRHPEMLSRVLIVTNGATTRSGGSATPCEPVDR